MPQLYQPNTLATPQTTVFVFPDDRKQAVRDWETAFREHGNVAIEVAHTQLGPKFSNKLRAGLRQRSLGGAFHDALVSVFAAPKEPKKTSNTRFPKRRRLVQPL